MVALDTSSAAPSISGSASARATQRPHVNARETSGVNQAVGVWAEAE